MGSASESLVVDMHLQYPIGVAGASPRKLVSNMPGDVCTLPEDRNRERSHKHEYKDEQDYF